jgi:hypothetical protein
MKPAMRLSTTLRRSELPAKTITDRLVSHYGLDVTMALLLSDTQTIYAWQAGRRPTGPNYRLLWTYYCFTFEPHKLSSAFHVLTWGRFARKHEARRVRAEPERFEDGGGI